MANWNKILYEADRIEQANKQGSDKPYGSFVDSISGDTEKVVIRNWAAKGRELTVSHPFISTGSWIRALPEVGAQYLTATRADDSDPQLFSTISKGNESRVDSYNKRLGVYRSLTPGEIEISSRGLAQNYFGSRAYNSSRAGMLLRVMDQDNLVISERSPIHLQKFLNNTSGAILDESRVGIVSRPKNTWSNFFPKINNKFLAEEYINLLNPAKSNPTVLFTSHRGHVIDLKGNEIKHKKTSLPLRMLQNYYAVDDTFTSFEIDHAGNYSLYLAQAASEGMYIEIPNGSSKYKIKKDVNWDIEGSKSSIIKGSESKDITGSKNTTISKALKISADSINYTAANAFTITSKGYDLNTSASFNIKATAEANIQSQTIAKLFGNSGTNIGSEASITQVNGQQIALAGGGLSVARVGDITIGIGNLGCPVISTISTGSPKVTCG